MVTIITQGATQLKSNKATNLSQDLNLVIELKNPSLIAEFNIRLPTIKLPLVKYLD